MLLIEDGSTRKKTLALREFIIDNKVNLHCPMLTFLDIASNSFSLTLHLAGGNIERVCFLCTFSKWLSMTKLAFGVGAPCVSYYIRTSSNKRKLRKNDKFCWLLVSHSEKN